MPVPRYFFHTANGSRQADVDGSELSDLQAARLEAIKLIGALLAESPGVVADGHDFYVDVADASGSVLCTVIISTKSAHR